MSDDMMNPTDAPVTDAPEMPVEAPVEPMAAPEAPVATPAPEEGAAPMGE